MRNKSDLDTLSMDDLYNNLKVYEAEIKGQSSSNSNSLNVAFVSLDNTSSTNEAVNAGHNVFAASSQGQASASTYADDVMAPRSQGNRNGDNTRRVVPVETPANALIFIDGMDYDWSYEAEEGPTDFVLIYLNNKSDMFESASDSSVNESEEDNNQANDRYKAGEGYHAVPPSYTGNFMFPRPDLSFVGLDDSIFKSAISETITSMHETETSTSKTVNAAKQSSPRAEASTSTARYVNTAANRPTVNGTKPSSNVFHKSHSPVRRTFNQRTTPKNSDLKETVNTVKHARFGDRGNVIDYIFKDSGSYMLKRFNYVDLQGRLKSATAWVPKKTNSLILCAGSFLIDYQEIDVGFVAFGGNPKGVLLKVPRQNNMYSFDLKNVVPSGGLTCLFAKAIIDESNLWHKRLGHINFKTMNKLVRGNLVRGLPSKIFKNDHTCVACQKGKQHKASCKTKLVSFISQPLQILHMDLFGLTFVKSLNNKMYCLVVTDDFSRFSWVFFSSKDETSGILKSFITEAARTMLADSLLPTTFWAEAVSTACYVQNRILVTKPHNMTPYKLLIGKSPNLDFMKPFGCPVTILNTLDHLGKFEGKADGGFLVAYSVNSIEINANARKVGQEKASDHEYILLLFMPSSTQSSDDKDAGEVPDKGDKCVSKGSGIDDQEKTDSSAQDVDTAEPNVNNASININIGSLNINIIGSNDPSMPSLEETDIFDEVYNDREVGAEADTNNLELSTVVSLIPTTRVHKDHHKEQIIGDLNLSTQTRRMLNFSEENAM
nr:hypothetical protein [Tanacetum cinerariifolium]